METKEKEKEMWVIRKLSRNNLPVNACWLHMIKDEPTAVDQEVVQTTSMDMSIDCRRNRMNRQSRHVHDHPHILSLSRILVLKLLA